MSDETKQEEEIKEHEGWTAGDRVRVLSDSDQDEGLFQGDEGVISFEKVGAPEYGNERVAVLIKTEQMDPFEVSIDNIEEA